MIGAVVHRDHVPVQILQTLISFAHDSSLTALLGDWIGLQECPQGWGVR